MGESDGLAAVLVSGCSRPCSTASSRGSRTRSWSAAGRAEEGGWLIGLFNGVGLITTLGVPLIADRIGTRRGQLVLSGVAAIIAFAGINLAPGAWSSWVVLLGLALGAVFPLVLTLPLDVADAPSQVGAVAALMLFGGYLLSSVGPFVLGADPRRERRLLGQPLAALRDRDRVHRVLPARCPRPSPRRARGPDAPRRAPPA